jgi:hypothetical protein
MSVGARLSVEEQIQVGSSLSVRCFACVGEFLSSYSNLLAGYFFFQTVFSGRAIVSGRAFRLDLCLPVSPLPRLAPLAWLWSSLFCFSWPVLPDFRFLSACGRSTSIFFPLATVPFRLLASWFLSLWLIFGSILGHLH